MKAKLALLILATISSTAMAGLRYEGVPRNEPAKLTCDEPQIQVLLDRISKLLQASVRCDRAQLNKLSDAHSQLANYWEVCDRNTNAVLDRASDDLMDRIYKITVLCMQR